MLNATPNATEAENITVCIFNLRTIKRSDKIYIQFVIQKRLFILFVQGFHKGVIQQNKIAIVFPFVIWGGLIMIINGFLFEYLPKVTIFGNFHIKVTIYVLQIVNVWLLYYNEIKFLETSYNHIFEQYLYYWSYLSKI